MKKLLLTTIFVTFKMTLSYGQITAEMKKIAEKIIIERTDKKLYKYDCNRSGILNQNTYWPECYDSTFTKKEIKRAEKQKRKEEILAYFLHYTISFDTEIELDVIFSFDSNKDLVLPIPLPEGINEKIILSKDSIEKIALKELALGIKPYEIKLLLVEGEVFWLVANTLTNDPPSGQSINVDPKTGTILNRMNWEISIMN